MINLPNPLKRRERWERRSGREEEGEGEGGGESRSGRKGESTERDLPWMLVAPVESRGV